ncbi:MAG: hypothetical protein E6Q97_08460 [Desulfurellales bacterium]|nr:MAG: hypothetical protein E6Q97_08460 [Desulfurellales bacterium]
MPKECWRSVKGFEGYYKVSNLGRVKSVGRPPCKECGRQGKAEKFMKAGKNRYTGYHAVSMSKPGMGSGTVVVWLIHRLVATHFVKGRSKKRPWVNHKDSNRSNNAAANLEWVSPMENHIHMHKAGRWKRTTYKNPWPVRKAKYGSTGMRKFSEAA